MDSFSHNSPGTGNLGKIFCTNCGTPLPAGSKFCMMCGTMVVLPKTEPVQPPVQEPVAPPVQEPVAQPVQEPVAQPVQEPVAPPVQEPVAPHVQEPVAQPVQEPVAPPKPAANPANKNAVKRKSVFENKLFAFAPQKCMRAILSVFLCILIFAVGIYATVVSEVRYATSRSGIRTMITDNKISSLEIEGETVVDIIGGEFEASFEDLYIESKQLEKYIDRPEMAKFIAREASDIFDSIYSGDDDAEITYDEVYGIIVEGQQFLSEKYGLNSSVMYAPEITEWAYEFLDVSEISADAVKADARALYYALNIGCSTFMLVMAIILCCLLLVILASVKQFSILRLMRSVGIILVAIGSIFLIPNAIAVISPSLWELICFDSSLVGFASTAFMNLNFTTNFAIFAIGVCLLVIRAIVVAIAKKQMKVEN